MLTLLANLPLPVTPSVLPDGYAVREMDREDLEAVGRLYFEANEPGVACATLGEAVDDIVASFDGEYGEFWFEASPVVLHGDDPVAAVMTVRRAPWDDVPDCPFIIELFTDRAHRRQGLACHLITSAAETIRSAGETAVALRVDAANGPARRLYGSLGFAVFSGTDGRGPTLLAPMS